MKNQYLAESYFNFEFVDSVFEGLFKEKKYIWEVIPQIGAYLSNLFDQEKIKGNYAKNVYIHPSAQVDTTARIVGPCFIDENAEVRFNSYIRENVMIGRESVIGHASEIKNSVLLYHSSLSHFNIAEDSLIGNFVRIGAGAITANRRLDRGNVIIRSSNERIDTGLTRFGSIIDDKTRVGVNAVLNPGTIIGKNSFVFPLTSVIGVHPDNSTIK